MTVNLLARCVGIFLGSILVVFHAACCTQPQTATAHPAAVRGWQTWDHFGVRLIGELVLRKGEASDNGNLGVRVLGIRAGKAACRVGREPIEPDVTVLFYKLADPNVTCTITTAAGSRLLQCDERLGLNMLAVLAINSEEGWVYFRVG
jgi:hypothetical protein